MKNEPTDISEARTNRDLRSLSNSILPLAKRILGKKGFVEVDILTNWEQIVGSELASYSLPTKIDFKRNQRTGGILHLSVPGGAFALELQHREKFILEKINTYFGYAAVSNLRIMQNSAVKIEDASRTEAEKRHKTLVSPDEENYIKELTEEITNPGLKEILTKLGQSVFTDNHKKEKK